MFGRMMNNYYYGKSGKGDFTKDNLPKNRWQLFWAMLRVRLSGLFRLNLTTALVFLPVLLVSYRFMEELVRLGAALQEAESNLAAASPELQNLYAHRSEYIYALISRAFLYLVPCLSIQGPFQAGMAYVCRNWARDEHAFVWSDFKDAVRDNWKQGLLVSVITAFVPLLVATGWRFYGNLAGNSLFFVVPQMLTLTIGVLWFMMLVFLYPMLVSYQMGFGTLLKNSLLLAVGKLPQNIGIRLITLAPALLVYLASGTSFGVYALMLLGGYYLFIGNALARFIHASYSNAVFDRYINNRIEGATVGRGMLSKEQILEQEALEHDDEEETD